MGINLKKDFDVIKAKSKINENEVAKKLMTALSEKKTTPINILDLQIDKIEVKYLSYLYQRIDYNYSVTANIGYNRDVHQYVSEIRRDSNGNERIVQVKKYSHTETDWKGYSNSSSFNFEDFVAMNNDKDNSIIKSINDLALSKLKINELEHDKNTKLSFVNDINDIGIVRFNILNRSKDELESHIKKSTPGDKYRNLEWHSQLANEECTFVIIPVFFIEYSYEGKIYTAHICDTLNYENYNNFPEDQILKETRDKIANKWLIPFLGVLVFNLVIWFLYSDDPYFSSIEWWMYGISATFVIVKIVKSQMISGKEFKPVMDEKDIRLNEKLATMTKGSVKIQ